MRMHTIMVLSWICLLLSPGPALAQYHDSEAGGTATSGWDSLGAAGGVDKIKFYERQSNFGDCDWLPPGSTCLAFSDKYKWIVQDYRINLSPTVVTNSNCLPVELIRCYYADYYHILGTSLVAIGEVRKSEIPLNTPPLACQQHPSSLL